MRRVFPDVKMLVLLGPALLLLVCSALSVSRWARAARKVRTDHAGYGLGVMTVGASAALYLAMGLPAVILFAVIVGLVASYSSVYGDVHISREPGAHSSVRPIFTPSDNFFG